MTYYGYDSDASANDGRLIVSGEHLDAVRACYGYDAVQQLNKRILDDIKGRLKAMNCQAGAEKVISRQSAFSKPTAEELQQPDLPISLSQFVPISEQ